MFFYLFKFFILNQAQNEIKKGGSWKIAGTVVGKGEVATIRMGPKIKIEGADDRAALDINSIAYEVTFTEVSPDGQRVLTFSPVYEGVLSSALSGAFSTDRVIELDEGTYDWKFEIKRYEDSCLMACGEPMLNVYEWVPR